MTSKFSTSFYKLIEIKICELAGNKQLILMDILRICIESCNHIYIKIYILFVGKLDFTKRVRCENKLILSRFSGILKSLYTMKTSGHFFLEFPKFYFWNKASLKLISWFFLSLCNISYTSSINMNNNFSTFKIS